MSEIANIKCLILDVDGVLTDGRIYYGASGEMAKQFYIHDGYGLKQLIKAGVHVAVISGRSGTFTEQRLNELGITNYHLSVSDKLVVLNDVLNKLNLSPDDCAYIGDDIPDQACMETVRFAIAPANAVPAVKNVADWVTERNGGEGAVREACDAILEALES